MRRISQSDLLILWIGIGVLAATVAANRLFASGLVNYEVLYRYMQGGWQRGLPDGREGIWDALKILTVRLSETAVVEFVCRKAAQGGRRRIGIYLLLFYSGAVTGVSVVLTTWCCGIRGIFFCMLSCIPHYGFYLPVWGIFILRSLGGYETRRGRFWAVVGLLFLAGVWSEVWLNPFFLSFIS